MGHEMFGQKWGPLQEVPEWLVIPKKGHFFANVDPVAGFAVEYRQEKVKQQIYFYKKVKVYQFSEKLKSRFTFLKKVKSRSTFIKK